MKYKNVAVEWVTISIYLGDKFKYKHWKENESFTSNKLSEAGLNNFGVECPIDDLVCVQFEETKEKVIEFYTKAKKVFDKVYVNLYLNGWVKEGNSIDISLEEYLKLVEEEKE